MGLVPMLAALALLQAKGGSVALRPTAAGEAVALAHRAPAPRIDGRLDDSVWARATPLGNFLQRDPDEGAAASERTEVRVLYDDEALFVGVHAWDSHPDLITAPLARRDEAPPSDWIGIMIDSYHDRRTAFEFAVNPAGVKRDIYHFNDGEQDPTWDAVWRVGVTRDSSGWSAEFRIPWSQLKFGAGSDRRFGFNVWRSINRTNELQHWKLMAKSGQGDASRYGELTGLDDLHPRRGLEVTPYSVLGRSMQAAEPGNPFRTGRTARATLGADIRYALSSNLTLSAALNPDFGQVEADPAVVNLSATETFYPEKRPFFTEGSDVFRFRASPLPWSNEQFFYTRRIGRSPQLSADARGGYVSAPVETTILGAAKVQGKTPSGWTIGGLAALTTEETANGVDALGSRFTSVVEPRTAYGVARLGRDFGKGRTAISSFATLVHRDLPASVTSLRSDAVAAGLEFNSRLPGNRWYLRGALIASRVAGSAAAIEATQRSSVHYYQRPDAGYGGVDPTRTSLTGYGGFAEIRKDAGNWLTGVQESIRSPGLELNDAGYLTSAGGYDGLGWISRQWLQPGRLFRSATVRTNVWLDLTYRGEANDRGMETFGELVLKNYNSIHYFVGTQFGSLDPRALRGGPALAYPGGGWLGGQFSSDQRRALRLTVNADHWDAFAGRGHGSGAGVMVAWRPSGRLDLSVGPRYGAETSSRQFVASGNVAGAPAYVVGELDQKTVSLATRGNFTFAPTLSFQLYAEPFISSGRYLAFKRVVNPRSPTEGGRFEHLGEDRLIRNGTDVSADFNRDGVADLSLGSPDFTVLSLRSTAVLRWEFRSGSSAFLVWQQERGADTPDGRFRLGENLGDLFGANARNTLLLKISWWLAVR